MYIKLTREATFSRNIVNTLKNGFELLTSSPLCNQIQLQRKLNNFWILSPVGIQRRNYFGVAFQLTFWSFDCFRNSCGQLPWHSRDRFTCHQERNAASPSLRDVLCDSWKQWTLHPQAQTTLACEELCECLAGDMFCATNKLKFNCFQLSCKTSLWGRERQHFVLDARVINRSRLCQGNWSQLLWKQSPCKTSKSKLKFYVKIISSRDSDRWEYSVII